MAGRAQETATLARMAAQAKSDVLSSEYAEVNEEVLQQTRDAARRARLAADELTQAVMRRRSSGWLRCWIARASSPRSRGSSAPASVRSGSLPIPSKRRTNDWNKRVP